MSVEVTWMQPTPVGPVAVSAACVDAAWAVTRIRFGDEAETVACVGDPVAGFAAAVDDWFAGRRHTLDVAFHLDLPPGLRRDVLLTLHREVPWGETVSYGELAQLAGHPGAARAVGSAMATNPVPFVIPCHRVIAAGGRIGGYGGTAATASQHVAIKRYLLAREGITLHP